MYNRRAPMTSIIEGWEREESQDVVDVPNTVTGTWSVTSLPTAGITGQVPIASMPLTYTVEIKPIITDERADAMTLWPLYLLFATIPLFFILPRLFG